jgi:hypothetical protein
MLGNEYDQYVKNLSAVFAQALANVEVAYNFDHGDEFEVALAETLEKCLPEKYGVCRGMVVAPNGEEEGDDLIIYDRMNYPCLRVDRGGLSLKQRIPIEAVYAYIEAKNCRTIVVDDSDNESIARAVAQVAKVRKLVETRAPVPAPIVLSDTSPTIKNPFFGVVMSNRVRDKPKGKILEGAQEIIATMVANNKTLQVLGADFVALGQDLAFLPVIDTKWEVFYTSPFARTADPRFRFDPITTQGNSFGMFFASLMSAIGSIELGPFPWRQLVNGFFVRHYLPNPKSD